MRVIIAIIDIIHYFSLVIAVTILQALNRKIKLATRLNIMRNNIESKNCFDIIQL